METKKNREQVEDDRRLVERFKKGEEKAFNELVRKYQQQIYQVARRLLKSHQEAEDIAQEVFIKAYHQLKNFRGEASISTWLYRIAVNMSLNVIRKNKIRQIFSIEAAGMSIESKNDLPDKQVENAETMQAISRAIDKLPNKQKLVFTLRYHQGLSHSEIASIMKRDVGTVRANYHQAIRKLQKAVRS